jgi:hypothetical protein
MDTLTLTLDDLASDAIDDLVEEIPVMAAPGGWDVLGRFIEGVMIGLQIAEWFL